MAQDSNLISPFIGPDVLARQLRMQQQQQYGQRMLEQGSEIPQGQMVSGHFVAPSWSQYLAQGLKSYMGGKALRDLPEQQAQLNQDRTDRLRSMFRSGGNADNAPAQALALGSMQGSTGPTNANAQRLGAALSGKPMIPSLPGRSEDESFMIGSTVGMPEYMKMVAQQGAPTDIQKNMLASGIQPGSPQWNQALSATTSKAGYIPPVSVAPGATMLDPRTMQPGFSAPQNGIQTQYGPNGQPIASQVPGFAGAQADIAGAETSAQEGARAQFDLVDVPDGQGGTVKMPRDQAVQMLGGGGGQRGQQQPPGLGSSPSPVSQDAAKTLNNNWISGAYQPALDNANAARSLLGTIQGMRNIDLQTGFGTEMKGAAANLLTSLGVKDAAKLATDVQKFQSLAMDRLQTELMKQKGPQTEGDAIRAGQTFARLGNTPEANKFIFDFAQAKANADIRKAEFYQAALPIARRAGDLTEIDRRWAKVRGSIFDDPILAPYSAYAGTAEGSENGNP